ncbi:MAG: GPR endopeptidase [Lachnospiraceae bacterium]|nr:GPR endopeptidase [Ruminococcus sp.]MCM1275206.1 GPR endopeptidase [Lachnospiraceae bacterium]
MDNGGLAFEAAEIVSRKSGIRAVTRTIGGVKITDARLDARAAARTGKRAGRYITLEGEPSARGMTALFHRALLQVLPPRGRIFTAGLGNPDITQDSLGALAVRSMTAGKGRRFSLSAIETDVAARTGLDTARLVRAAARGLGADCVIAVDALACRDPRYIGRTVQISDAGIIPGGGAGAARTELSRGQLGLPIAAVGVPTVSALSSVTGKKDDRALLITTADIDVVVKMWAEVIGGGIGALAE